MKASSRTTGTTPPRRRRSRATGTSRSRPRSRTPWLTGEVCRSTTRTGSLAAILVSGLVVARSVAMVMQTRPGCEDDEQLAAVMAALPTDKELPPMTAAPTPDPTRIRDPEPEMDPAPEQSRSPRSSRRGHARARDREAVSFRSPRVEKPEIDKPEAPKPPTTSAPRDARVEPRPQVAQPQPPIPQARGRGSV